MLIVEDDESLRSLLDETFTGAGFIVDVAEHGAEAIRKLRARRYDAVVLDLVLPWTNGYAVLDAMRDDRRYVRVPVVVITGSNATIADLWRFPNTMLLRKPFDPEALVALIEGA